MIRRFAVVNATIIGAIVFTGTTPAQAADQSAIKQAIVATVLNNLGVQPTDQLVNEIVGEIPLEFFDSTLVLEVGTALDNSEDPTLMISQTVDSDGDGIPNADATVDSDDETVDEDADDPGDENVDETEDDDGEDDGEDDEKDDGKDEDEDEDVHDGDD